MDDSIIVYSLPTCGMCSMLKKLLTENNIPFSVCEDTAEMERLQISHVPVLSVSGELYSFKDALKLIKEGGLN